MRVLVIKATYPFPLNTGGSIVAYNNIKSLSTAVDMHLMCLGHPAEEGDVASLVSAITIVPRKKIGRLRQLGRYAVHACFGVPPSVAAHGSAEMRSEVARAIESKGCDAILIYEMSGIQYCPAGALRKVIVNVEDPQALKLRKSVKLSSWTRWQRAKMKLAAFITERYERRMLPRVGRVLLLSEGDAAALRASLGDASIAAIPYGVDARPDTDILDLPQRAAGSIVFSGNMFHPANVDAILHFLRAIFPMVLRLHPAAKLWIVGAHPHETVLRACLGFGSNAVVTGSVPDVQQYIRQSMVGICPVRLDIGVQTKVLEALSWGTPVVSTSAGNSGIRAVSGEHLWVEDEPARFAERIVSLLNGERWGSFSASGREFSRSRFSWARSAAELHRHLAAVAALETTIR